MIEEAERRLIEAFESGDPGAWRDLASCATPATLSAAVQRIAADDYDPNLARSGFLSLPPDAAPALVDVFEPKHPAADYVALSLAASRHPAAVEVLIGLLDDDTLSTIAIAGLSRQRDEAFPAIAEAMRTGKKAIRIGAVRVLEAWESDDDWTALVVRSFERERTADVRRLLQPLVEDALGNVSQRTIDALSRSMNAEESEHVASMLEQARYLGGPEFCPPELLEHVDRAWVAAHQHLDLLANARDSAVTIWWELAEMLEFTPVARWLSAELLYSLDPPTHDVWFEHLRRLADHGPAAITDVARIFGSRRLPEKRLVQLISWLAEQVTDDDIDLVARRLRSPDAAERDDAERALAAFGPPGGIAALDHLDAALAASRSAAARVLVAAPSLPAGRAVAERLPNERAARPRALLVEAWFAAESLRFPADFDPEDHGDWLDEAAAKLAELELGEELTRLDDLPILAWSGGRALSDDVVRWIAARARTQNQRGTDHVLVAIAGELHPVHRRAFHRALLGTTPDHGKPWQAHSWIALGDIESLIACRRWLESEDGRGAALASSRVRALGAAGSLGVILLLAWSADGSWRPDRARARAELERLAAGAAVTVAEHVVRNVPTLGFERQATRPWKLGTRHDLALAWRDSSLVVLNESGEALKSVPTPRNDDDPAEVAADLSALRALREAAGFVERTVRDHLHRTMLDSVAVPAGAIASWVGHPIVHPVAARILWGAPQPFEPPAPLRFDEVGGWADVEDLPVTLEPGAQIQPIHPADMPRDDRLAWMNVFGDYEILQPFNQLDRPVFRPRSDELSMTTFLRFGGRQIDAGRIRWLVYGAMGWRLSTSPSTWHRHIERPFRRWNLTAVLQWQPGFSIRSDDDDPPQVLRAGYILRGCDHTDLDLAERIPLIDAPPAVFSEIVYMIARAADAVDDHSFE